MSEKIIQEVYEERLVEKGHPRNPLVALLLSLCPGLGQQYAGYLGRGIILYITLIVVSWLAAVAFMFVDSRISMIFLAVPFIGILLIAADAWRLARKQPETYRLKWFNRPIIYVAVFVFLLVTVNPLMDMLIGGNIVRAFPVTSSSMAPTVLKNDLLVINKLAEPGRGDVVLVDYRGDGASTRLSGVIDIELFNRVVHSLFGEDEISYKDGQLVRRIVAVAGDTVEIRNGDLFVNGEKLDEPYINTSTDKNEAGSGPLFNQAFGPEVIPDGSFFVLGDNRNFSIDSRILGPVSKQKVAGKVTKVFWSWNLDENHIHWERTAMPVK